MLLLARRLYVNMADELENASEALLSFKNGIIKELEEEETMEQEFSPASLGLHRVGDALPPKPKPHTVQPALNRRGMPVRIRKKNRLFFDEDVVTNSDTVVPRSMLKTTRVKSPIKKLIRKPKEPAEPPPKLEFGDKKLGHKIGIRLRNLLKLPKAHKWVCYEWFYSDIDKALFGGENDFTLCLKESFPKLKTYNLTRVEWCKMRRIMGKPRRCSQAFLDEERRELERKRNKIRQLQQRKPSDGGSCKDLPTEIPLQLVIGTKVTARLRNPQDGLYMGSVDGFDTSNNTYRITFERPGLGTHSIPDYEVQSNEPIETISVASMVHALRPPKHHSESQPIEMIKDTTDSMSNGFPISVLENIVKLNKLLVVKSEKVSQLKFMNTEAESKKCHSQTIPDDFVKKYASNVVDLGHVNQALRQLLSSIQYHSQELLPSLNIGSIMTPNYLRNQSLEEARCMVHDLNSKVADEEILDLVIELTALLIQVKTIADSERSSYEIEVLTTSMNEIKKKLVSTRSTNLFENSVEMHIRHIQAGLNGELDAFSSIMSP